MRYEDKMMLVILVLLIVMCTYYAVCIFLSGKLSDLPLKENPLDVKYKRFRIIRWMGSNWAVQWQGQKHGSPFTYWAFLRQEDWCKNPDCHCNKSEIISFAAKWEAIGFINRHFPNIEILE